MSTLYHLKLPAEEAEQYGKAAMNDPLITDTYLFLNAYRNAPDWQERLQTDMAALVDFLHKHALLREGALDTSEARSGLFILRESDLTEDGLKLFHRPIGAYEKWLNANSNTNKPLSMRSLENGLKKVRGGQYGA